MGYDSCTKAENLLLGTGSVYHIDVSIFSLTNGFGPFSTFQRHFNYLYFITILKKENVLNIRVKF